MDYQILRSEEIVLVLHENHPLAAKAITRPGFRYPWLNLSLLKEENFILLYPCLLYTSLFPQLGHLVVHLRHMERKYGSRLYICLLYTSKSVSTYGPVPI